MTSSRSTAPPYCSACGARLSPGDAFCSQCGSAVGGSDPADADRAWLRRRVQDLEVAGWETVTDHGDRVVLRKRGFGSLLPHVGLFLISGGALNVVYALYRYTAGAPRREVRADGTEISHSDSDRGSRLWTAAGVLAGVVSVWVLAFFALNGSLLTALVLLFVLYLPLLALTLSKRQRASLSTFGRERTVEEESVRNPPEPCAACDDRVHVGVRRRYDDRLYAAGLPLRTYRAGENVYCRECAAANERERRENGEDGEEGDRDLDAELERLVES